VGACEYSNKPRVPHSAEDYLTSFGSVSFSGRALLHVVSELGGWMDILHHCAIRFFITSRPINALTTVPY